MCNDPVLNNVSSFPRLSNGEIFWSLSKGSACPERNAKELTESIFRRLC